MDRHAPRTRLRDSRWIAGLVLLAVGMAASLALASHYLTAKGFPYCGPHSGCAEALASRWSNIGGWPVAYVALCYFGGAILAWILARRHGSGAFLRYAVRLAVLA